MSDAMKYRTKEEAEKAKLRDPITLYELRLREKESDRRRADRAARRGGREAVHEAVRQADEDPQPPLEDRFEDALVEKYPYQPK